MNESHLGMTHLSTTIFRYQHNTNLQHAPSLPSSPKHKDQTTSPPPYPSWDGEELAGGLCLSLLRLPAVSSPARCQNSHRHRDPQQLWDRGTEETGKASKNWRGDYHLGLPMSRGISDEKVSHLPLPQPSHNTSQCCCTQTSA